MDKDYRDNIRKYFEQVEMPGGYSFDTAETIKTIDLYYNSKYKTGKYDNRGFRKFFYNIVKPATDIATKFIDLDTKDIILVPEHSNDEMRVWLMQRRLKQWLKDNNFGDLLNDIAFNLPKYGHIVVKKTGRKWGLVSLENLRTDPTARFLNDSSFVYEVNMMSASKIGSMNWNGNVKELLKRKHGQYIIYECYHKTEKGWNRIIKSDLYEKRGTLESAESQINNESEFLPSIVLDKREVEVLPYRELKWEEVRGRWLGLGFVEYLEDNQIAINEAENLERKGLMFTSLKLYQTSDQNVGGSNVLTDAENGDILTVGQNDQVTPVAVEERNLPAFNNTRANWNSNTERKTFTTDITTGANLPSRTPLGVANLQASLATSYFELKRENFGIFIKNIVIYDILPDFKKDTQKEHNMTFLGSDQELDKLDKAIIEARVADASMKHAEKTGFFPSRVQTDDARERIQNQLNRRKNRYLSIPKGFYENANFIVDVLVTGEQIDVGVKSQVIQVALQILSSNPAILQSPTTKAVFLQLLALGGVSPVELNIFAENEEPQITQQGGSISQPNQVNLQGSTPINAV